MNHSQAPSQAELWARFLKLRSDNLSPLASNQDIVDLFNQLAGDYPHQVFNLTNQGRIVGIRRVFRDRSYADAMVDASQEITIGKMSAGMLGTAGNGTIIH